MLSNSITQIYQNKQMVTNRNFTVVLTKFIQIDQVLTTAFKLFLFLENGPYLVFWHIKQYKFLLLWPFTWKEFCHQCCCASICWFVCLLLTLSAIKSLKRLRIEKLIHLWNWQFLEKVVYFLTVSIVFSVFKETFVLNNHRTIWF